MNQRKFLKTTLFLAPSKISGFVCPSIACEAPFDKSCRDNDAKRYRLQLIRLSRTLRRKWTEMTERYDNVILQHDNVRPHMALTVKNKTETLNCADLPRPLCLSSLASTDYRLFRQIHTFWSRNSRIKRSR